MWHSGSFPDTNPGRLLAVLDYYLPLNSHWSIYDGSAGVNCKVYECKDTAENCLFYMKVDDNQADWAQIEMWQGWDAVTHVGTGVGVTTFSGTYYMRINRPAGGWHLSVLDHRLIFINATACGTYVGQPVRYDTSKNIVMFIGESTGTSKYNPLSNLANTAANPWCKFLFDDGGGQGLGIWDNNYVNKNTYTRGIDGAHRIIESHIINTISGLIVGALDGVMTMGTVSNGLARYDVITVDGVDWMMINGDTATKYFAVVRKS